MRDRTAKFLSVTSLTFSLLFLWCMPVRASLEAAGHVILTNGPFIAIQTNASARSLSRGSEFYQGDRLWTGPRTRAQIRFSDGAIMTLRPDTEFSVDEYQFDEKNADNNTGFFTLIKGGFRTLTGLISKLRPDGYRVKTAYAIVGVRGTNYEVVDQSALYVAAWEGTISVTNNKSEMLLGFGQDFNYATITSINSAPKGTVEVPPPLQQTPDPGLQQAMVDPTETRLVTSLANDGIDTRLSPADVASLDRFGVTTATYKGEYVGGAASDGSTGSPLFYDTATDVVMRQGSATATNVQTDNTLAGFPVSFGEWNTATGPATLQINPGDASDIQPVTSDAFWITMIPTPASSLPTGRTYLSFNVNGVGSGSGGGPVTFVSFGADLDFAGGQLRNGNLQLSDGGNSWSANFAGQVTGATFTANVNGGTLLNSTTCASPSCTPQGTLAGGVTGSNADAVGGVFDFTGGPESVKGSFLAK